MVKINRHKSDMSNDTPQLMSDEELYNHLDLSYPELTEKERLELAAFINSQKIAWADYVIGEDTDDENKELHPLKPYEARFELRAEQRNRNTQLTLSGDKDV